MKLKARNLAIVLVLLVGILGALMASNSPSNLALGATTCGINGCVSTPPLTSSTSYSYTGTSVSTISATSSTFSTSISSSTTTTTATTTSTFFSYTSTISTTLTTTSYSTSFTATQTSTNTNWVTLATTTTTSSAYTNLVTQKGTNIFPTTCPVSYVTNGNRLQPYADFLRGFRDKVQNTTAGNAFMQTFNSWYYSWAPLVTYSAATSPWVFKTVQVGVIPLLGILYASYYSYSLVAPFNPEAGAIAAGIVAASLIGMAYLAPTAYIARRIIRRHSHLTISKLTAGPSAVWFAASVALCVAGYATASGTLLAVATSSIVLSTLSLGALVGARALAYVQLPFANPATMALLFRRYARPLP